VSLFDCNSGTFGSKRGRGCTECGGDFVGGFARRCVSFAKGEDKFGKPLGGDPDHFGGLLVQPAFPFRFRDLDKAVVDGQGCGGLVLPRQLFPVYVLDEFENGVLVVVGAFDQAGWDFGPVLVEGGGGGPPAQVGNLFRR
jgi:hypothetical protein